MNWETCNADQGFFAQGGGHEYPLMLGVAVLALAFTGPGTISLDAAFGFSLARQPGGLSLPHWDWPERFRRW